MSRCTIQHVLDNVAHYKALGIDSVIMDDDEPILWEYVTSIKTGGTYRLGLSTSQTVIAMHPCGIELRWFVDLEPRSANGTGVLQLDHDLIRQILEKAPVKASSEFRNWLAESAETVEKHATELRTSLRRVEDVAKLFRDAGRVSEGGAS